jgi:monofunctional glycosyltransferase
LRRLLKGLALLGLAALLASVGAVLAFRWVDPPFTAVMLLEPGPVGALAQTWVPRSEIAWDAARAVIAAEDQRFADHRGIDFRQLEQAIADYRQGQGLRGASTITQQVAKNLFLWHGRSLFRKALEAYFALLIEIVWTKERTLEVYLNVAEFGNGVFGVQAAAQAFFGKDAASLSLDEAALLAAVLPSPKRFDAARPSAYVRGRQVQIIAQVRLLETRGHYRGIEW